MLAHSTRHAHILFPSSSQEARNRDDRMALFHSTNQVRTNSRPRGAKAKKLLPMLPMTVMRMEIEPHRQRGGDERRRKRCARRRAVTRTVIVKRRCRTSHRQADGMRTGIWMMRVEVTDGCCASLLPALLCVLMCPHSLGCAMYD